MARESELAELARAKETAERGSTEKSNFLAHMSHELRTPLASIIGYVELIEEELGDVALEVTREDLRRVRLSARHMLALISGVLDLAKIERGELEVVRAPVDVGALLSEVTATVEPLATKNRNRIVSHVDRAAEVIDTDPTKVRQSLLNLMANASKFTEDGTVEVSVELDGAFVLFRVSDTGAGMSSEQVERVFRPYAQADASTATRFGGTGLGLAISRGLCELLGGSLECQSTLGRGSTFEMRVLHHR